MALTARGIFIAVTGVKCISVFKKPELVEEALFKLRSLTPVC